MLVLEEAGKTEDEHEDDDENEQAPCLG